MNRHLQWPGCYNIRDIGGYPAAKGKQTRWGSILRGDNLNHLTEKGRAALVDYGVRTIIDLRFRREVMHKPNPFAARNPHKIAYHHMPLRDEQDKAASAAFSLAKSFTEIYCRSLDWGKYHIANIMTRIADAPPGAVLVHCHVGKDRTGVVIGMLLDLAGVPHDIIAQDYAMSATCLKPLFVELREIEAEPETMLKTLAYLHDHYGGARHYLRMGGLPEETINRLHHRLVE